MYILLLLLTFNFSSLDDQWLTYFENKKIKISYEDVTCNDIINGVIFDYYLIKVKNKTSETLVINFYLGENEDDENKVAFVLNPNEIKTGSCDYQPIKLRLFKAQNRNKKSKSFINFSLNKIEATEVY